MKGCSCRMVVRIGDSETIEVRSQLADFLLQIEKSLLDLVRSILCRKFKLTDLNLHATIVEKTPNGRQQNDQRRESDKWPKSAGATKKVTCVRKRHRAVH